MLYFKNHNTGELYSPRDELQKQMEAGREEISYEDAAKISHRALKGLKSAVRAGKIEGTEENVRIDSLINYLTSTASIRRSRKRSRSLNNPLEIEDQERRKATYDRLQEMEARGKIRLDSDELKYVFGFSGNSYQTQFSKHEEIKDKVQRERGKYYFPIEAIKCFLEGRRVMSGKWIKK